MKRLLGVFIPSWMRSFGASARRSFKTSWEWSVAPSGTKKSPTPVRTDLFSNYPLRFGGKFVSDLSVKEHDLIFGENDIASQGHLFWDAAPDSMVYILSPSGDASKKVTLFECQDLPCCFVLTFCQEAILLPGSVSEEWLEILSHIKVWQLTHWAQHASCECWIDSTLHPSTRWYVWYQRFKLCGDEEQCNSWSQLRLVHLTCVGWRWISY